MLISCKEITQIEKECTEVWKKYLLLENSSSLFPSSKHLGVTEILQKHHSFILQVISFMKLFKSNSNCGLCETVKQIMLSSMHSLLVVSMQDWQKIGPCMISLLN